MPSSGFVPQPEASRPGSGASTSPSCSTSHRADNSGEGSGEDDHELIDAAPAGAGCTRQLRYAARDRLAFMRAENLPVSAAFGLSYADLTAGQQRLFVQLGLV